MSKKLEELFNLPPREGPEPEESMSFDGQKTELSNAENIIDRITSSSFGIIDFYNSVYDVIRTSTSTDLNTFNTIDRINIILNFRKNINSNYEGIDVKDIGAMSKDEVLQGLNNAKHSLHGDKILS